MSLITDRAGQVVIRVGGNTQDYATMVDSTADGRVIEKKGINPNNPVRSAREDGQCRSLTGDCRRPPQR